MPKKYSPAQQYISGGISPKKSAERILANRLSNLEKTVKDLLKRIEQLENQSIQPKSWNGL